MDFHRWFIPHRDTHRKAHLISWQALVVYISIFMLLQASFSFLKISKPGILGTTSNITISRIIELTNIERAKNNLPALTENSALNQAATTKAQNMFAENYWAHFAPSGKSPWDFILGSGYKFSVAGENLAKSFTTSEDVIVAWMNSSSHKENIVSNKYKDIGIAVEDGLINGEQTTLVVQMFGSTPTSLAAIPSVTVKEEVEPSPSVAPKIIAQASIIPVVEKEEVIVPKEDYEAAEQLIIQPTAVAGSEINPLFDPFKVSKTFGLTIVTLVSGLLLVDFIILRRRRVQRLSSHHFAHMAVLTVAAAALIVSSSGEIDKGLTFQAPPEIMGIYVNNR